ncbi:hypothetical protein JYP52_22095 [Nitratireductor aquibiodomus]|uniref:hypothetical protein n=1 Tax=Nitratireductor aquibiodomus TaxID=204799 RepID=UPI0019D3449E|nr:hypothetical protein [Nitratireductor aquibiodomus]MBN7763834.1 hypothetical protein [Nitratireductor aquibiodomus]
MSKIAHTPGPWHRNIKPARKYPTVWAGRNTHIAAVVAGAPYGSGNGETMSDEEMEANIDLIAAAPEMLEALRLHKAWSDSENSGPDYGGQTRDTHPDGERIWRAWWNNQLDLCDRAQKATEAAISKATGGAA